MYVKDSKGRTDGSVDAVFEDILAQPREEGEESEEVLLKGEDSTFKQLVQLRKVFGSIYVTDYALSN